MEYDPNWFYSSVAQASAAIVGLMGVILIPRLDDQITTVRSTRQGVVQALNNLRSHAQRMADEVETYSNHHGTIAALIDTAIAKDQRNFSFPGDMDLFGAVVPGPPTMVADTDHANERRKKVEKAGLILKELLACKSVNNCDDAYVAEKKIDYLLTLIAAQNHYRVTQLSDCINAIRGASRVNEIRASIGLTGTMAAIIAWLCVCGMIVPLGFLTAIDGPSKWGLLIAFALGVLALPAYIAFELLRIKRLASVDLATEEARREATQF